MSPLKNVLPIGDRVQYGFETIQNTRYSDRATVDVHNLVCVRQLCRGAKMMNTWRVTSCDVSKGNTRFGTPRSKACYLICVNRASGYNAIAHNAMAFVRNFNQNRVVLLKGLPEMIMIGMKITCI